MSWLKKKIEEPHFELLDYGTMKLNKNRNGFEWFGHVNLPISKIPIELTIEVEGQNMPSYEQALLIKEFVNQWQKTSSILYEYMAETFRNSKWQKEKDELKNMYFLSAIDLKRDNYEWWIILEPEFDVVSIFNFLPRFTMKNDEIIWSNLK